MIRCQRKRGPRFRNTEERERQNKERGGMEIQEVIESRRDSDRGTKLERDREHGITRGGKNERGDGVE